MSSKHLRQSLTLAALLGSGCVADQGFEGETGAILEQPILVAVPARIEAESYERAFDSTPDANFGQQCNRGDGVDMETTLDPKGGGCNVGWTTPGEWLEYDITTPTARSFTITNRVASAFSGKTFHIELDGVNLGSLTSPSSGWQSWGDRSYTNVNLSAGAHRLRVVFDTGDVNLNYIELTSNSSDCRSVALNRSSATASSIEGSAWSPARAIDGDLGTRWSSAFSDPQWIVVDLGTTRRVNRVLLRWEAAYSTRYDVEVAKNPNGPWTKVFGTTSGDGGNDDISGFDATGRYVRMFSHARKTQWGNSLWEFEVFGDNDPSCPTPGPSCTDGIKNGTETDVDCGGTTCGKCPDGKTCASGNDCSSGFCSPAGVCAQAPSCTDGIQNGDETGVDCGGSCPPCVAECAVEPLARSAAAASSIEGPAFPASNAIDGNSGTRWSSAFEDPQWIRVDLGATRFIGRVVLDWETAYSRDYDIQVSNGADGPWTTIHTNPNGDGGRDDITDLNATARYVRVFSRARATGWGNSLFEVAIYGDDNPDCSAAERDSDGDRLPDSVETNTGVFLNSTDTGTDPFNPDTDGDGIPDGDEVLGTTGGLDLPAMGVSPLKKNILLEYDWFDDALDCAFGFHSHRPTQGAIDRLSQAFADAPVSNPDGSTGIVLINDFGQGGPFTGGNLINDPDGVIAGNVFGADYQNYRAAHFAANRHGYFHYVLMPHRYELTSSSSGFAEIIGDEMIVSLQCAGQDALRGDSNIANTIMHELGHNLGLRHGGFEDNNWKPNYNSVMNFEYQFSGVDVDCVQFGDGVTDFSRGLRMDINENFLNETAGLCNGIPWDFDWRIPSPPNPNGQPPNGIQENVYALDITQDGLLTNLQDQNDWAVLVYDFAPSGTGFSLQALSVQEYAECDNPPPMP